MSNVASNLVKNLIDGVQGIDTQNLYINIDFVDNDLMFIEYRYKDKKTAVTGFRSDAQKGENGILVTGDLEAQLATSNDGAKGQCWGAYIIRSVSVRPQGGWGRLLYYIAMHFSGNKGITADREKSSASAVGAWNNLFGDNQVTKKPLDDIQNPITPSSEDDCNLASSGIYGMEKSKSSYEWNPMLLHGDSHEKSTEEDRLEKGEHYRKIKASKLNYVYYWQSPEIIEMLQKAGKLVINGQMNESINLFTLIYNLNSLAR